MPHKSSQKS